MEKKLIRLTEADLHKLIKESVKNVLTELDWRTYVNAARKREAQGLNTNANDLYSYAGDKSLEHYGIKPDNKPHYKNSFYPDFGPKSATLDIHTQRPLDNNRTSHNELEYYDNGIMKDNKSGNIPMDYDRLPMSDRNRKGLNNFNRDVLDYYSQEH